jgi:preprotein translocase subunit SecG
MKYEVLFVEKPELVVFSIVFFVFLIASLFTVVLLHKEFTGITGAFVVAEDGSEPAVQETVQKTDYKTYLLWSIFVFLIIALLLVAIFASRSKPRIKKEKHTSVKEYVERGLSEGQERD